MNNKMNLNVLISILLKWKWHILTITIISIALSAVFTSPQFIKPLYKSEMILLPANLSPVSNESETEQMLQYLQSTDIRDSIIKKYKLDDHYKISPDYVHYKTAINGTWAEMVNITPTRFGGVKVEVKDVDPVMAYDICKDINYFYNKKINELQDAKSVEVIAMLKRQLNKKGLEIDSLKALYKSWCDGFELVGFQQELNGANEKFYTQERNSIKRETKYNIRTNDSYTFKKDVGANYDEFKVLSTLIEGYTLQYVECQRDYDIVVKQKGKDFTFSSVVSNPQISDKKCYPVRWLIVLGVTVPVVLLFMLVVIFLDRKKGYKIY